MHYINVDHPSQIDDEVLSWITEAYHQAPGQVENVGGPRPYGPRRYLIRATSHTVSTGSYRATSSPAGNTGAFFVASRLLSAAAKAGSTNRANR